MLKLREYGQAVIYTWIMSCQALKSTVEVLLMIQNVDRFCKRGALSLSEECILTEKKRLVANHATQLGFGGTGPWINNLDLNGYRRLHAKIITGEQDDQ
jgi:predicted enzyme involved in methoxymalonyl-ACP biosynthesis